MLRFKNYIIHILCNLNELIKYIKPFGFFLILIIFIISFFDQNDSSISSSKKNILSPKEIKSVDDYPSKSKKYLPSLRPENGFSPFNDLFGRGIYNNSTDNIITVTAPKRADIVIFIKDIYSKRVIRNEYVRAGSVFSLTGVPFGSYKFIYIHGNNWSAYAPFKEGEAFGNFLSDKGVGKSDKFFDVEFEEGYYGTYSLTLQLMSNGNLTTVSGSEQEI